MARSRTSCASPQQAAARVFRSNRETFDKIVAVALGPDQAPRQFPWHAPQLGDTQPIEALGYGDGFGSDPLYRWRAHDQRF